MKNSTVEEGDQMSQHDGMEDGGEPFDDRKLHIID